MSGPSFLLTASLALIPVLVAASFVLYGLASTMFGWVRREPVRAMPAPASKRAPVEPVAPPMERAPIEPVAPVMEVAPVEPARPEGSAYAARMARMASRAVEAPAAPSEIVTPRQPVSAYAARMARLAKGSARVVATDDDPTAERPNIADTVLDRPILPDRAPDVDAEVDHAFSAIAPRQNPFDDEPTAFSNRDRDN